MVTRRTRLVVPITPASLDGDDAAVLRDRADWAETHDVLTTFGSVRTPCARLSHLTTHDDRADSTGSGGEGGRRSGRVGSRRPQSPARIRRHRGAANRSDVPHFGPIQAGLTARFSLPNGDMRAQGGRGGPEAEACQPPHIWRTMLSVNPPTIRPAAPLTRKPEMLPCPGWSIPAHEGGERKRETAPTRRARRVDAGARRDRPGGRDRSSVVVVTAAPVAAGASAILPPSNPSVSVPPQVMPACSLSPVDDTSARLHRLRPAQHQLRTLTRGSRSSRVAERLRHGPGRRAAARPHRRGARRPRAVRVLRARCHAERRRADRRRRRAAIPPCPRASKARAGPSSPRTTRRWGPTSPGCTTTATAVPTSTAPHPATAGVGATATTSSGTGRVTAGHTAMMGDGSTSAGQYAEIFATQVNPADSLVDPITPGSLPTPSTATPPDVVQVLPASSPNTGAGTPVTIEGNYFTASPVPTVYFGGVPATNVHVNWNGELTADAPADPAGSASDQVVVTVATTGGSSSSTGSPAVNEFTYAPTGAPTITSVSPTSGSQIPSGSVTIHGSNFADGGVTPIVDFGTVASIGSISYNSNLITTTIPPSINPGTVDITVTTPAGTSSDLRCRPVHLHREPHPGGTRLHQRRPDHVLGRRRGRVRHHDDRDTRRASSVTDAAFSGCTPSTLPGQHQLRYAGGSTATLEGTPRAGDGGIYTVCLNASNGVAPTATAGLHPDHQRTPPPLAASPPPPPRRPRLARLLAGGIRRWHLQLRVGPVPRLHRLAASATPRRRHHPHGRPGRLLARRLRRWHLRLRRCGLPRVDPR